MLRGIGTSKGIGIGKALIIHKCKNAVSRAKINDTEAEVDKFNEAVEKFIQETNELVDKLSQKLNGDDKNALVLKNQEYLIRDPEFTSGVISAITNDKLNAEAAVEDTCEMLKNIFLSFNNDTMTQRVADIEDMKQRLIAIMQGQKHIDLTKLSDNTVIIADEIHPSMTANMDTEHIAGIISEKGGDTSHASILARALEIPAVLSVKDICSKIAEGEEVIVDGAYGEVFVNPTPITLKIYNKKKKAYDWMRLGCFYDVANFFGTSIPEVTNVKHNPDGTITLTVDAVCEMVLCNEAVITHELTVKFAKDGSFKYLGNKILNNGIEEIPTYQYRICKG